MQNSYEFQGQQVYWEVSPCSWMYAGYGLQVRMALTNSSVNAGSEFINDKSLDASKMDAHWRDDAAKALVAAWLLKNGLAPLEAKMEAWAKAQAEFAIESAKEQEREEKRQATYDRKMKAQGFTYRVDGWIHPSSGDDRLFQGYSKGEKPTPAEVAAAFLKRSVVKDDYRITAL